MGRRSVSSGVRWGWGELGRRSVSSGVRRGGGEVGRMSEVGVGRGEVRWEGGVLVVE